MLPILVGVGAVALAGLMLEGCGGESPERDGGVDIAVPPPPPPPPHQNSSPVLSVQNNVNIYQEINNEVTVTATDQDGDNIQLSARYLPSSSIFRVVESRPGFARGIFSWNPECNWNLEQPVIRFSASDGRRGLDEEIVRLRLMNLIVSGNGVYNVNQNLNLCPDHYQRVQLNIAADNVTVNGNNSTLENIELVTGGVISGQNRRNISINSINIIATGAAEGIRFRDSTNVNLSNINIRVERVNNGGILFSQVSQGSLSNITVNGGIIDSAIFLGACSYLNLTNVVISGGGPVPLFDNPLRIGMLTVHSSHNITIDRSRVSGSGISPGISLTGTRNSSISRTEVFRNNDHGIRVGSSSSNIIENCNIHDNQGFGITLGGIAPAGYSNNNVIQNNRIANNRNGSVSNQTENSGNIFRGNMPPP